MHTSKFAQYAAEASKRMFLGTLVKFAKGDWQMGADGASISLGQRFVVIMGTLTIGHIKWVGGKPVDHRMGLVADGFSAAHRNDLDDLDSTTWEIDKDRNRIDPWQKTTLLVLAAPTAPYDLFTFATGTVGGEGAVRDLCEAHARTTEGVGQYPVVTFASDSYPHKNRAYGRVKVPVFKIVEFRRGRPVQHPGRRGARRCWLYSDVAAARDVSWPDRYRRQSLLGRPAFAP